MQHDTPTATAGVDWATDTNELCIVDAAGRVVTRRNLVCDAAGIRCLVDAVAIPHVTRVAIERPDGPVVDALLAADVDVVVVTPRQVRHLRARYRMTGKDDRFDAYVLAAVARTDGPRLVSLTPDTPATLALRSVVRARTDLVEARVAICNQLRAHLRVVFPAVVGLFSDLDSPISLAFLTRFATVERAAWLGERRLGAWLAANGYPGRQPARVLLTRLHSGPDVEIGDARRRFPTNAALAALAGAAPSTKQSGRFHVAVFRWARDPKLRDAVIDFAADSRRASPCAAAIYDRHRAAGKTHQHATRILARAWLRVIWRCWHDHRPRPHQTPRQQAVPHAHRQRRQHGGLTQGISCVVDPPGKNLRQQEHTETMMIVQRESSRSDDDSHVSHVPQEDDARRAWLAMYRLFRSDEFQRAGAEAAQAEDLTPQQLATLLALPVDPNEGLSMRELAEACRSTASYMTSVVDRLEERGFVGRHTDPRDRRVAQVRLTEDGRGAAARVQRRLSEPPSGLRDLSPTDVRTLRVLLERAAERYPWQ